MKKSLSTNYDLEIISVMCLAVLEECNLPLQELRVACRESIFSPVSMSRYLSTLI